MTMQVTNWHDCYGDGWQGIITKESFAHPAKFSKALIERIFDYCLERGWLKKNDLVGDCFGGIGNGGIIAAYRGLRWVGCELEPRFVKFAQENFELHANKWRTMGLPEPQIVKGDSRKFHEVVSCSGVVTSPPYISGGHHPDQTGSWNTNGLGQNCGGTGMGSKDAASYGTTTGQIGRLKSGNVSAVITSPPYAATSGKGGGGINVNGYVPAKGRKWTGGHVDAVGSRTYQGQGGDRAEGNIETLQPGNLNAVVTSPPWEKGAEGSRKAGKFKDPAAVLKCNRGHGASDAAVLAQAARDEEKIYGESPGQIGNASKETYWQAMLAVYSSCYLAIKPGGVIAVVVKDYVAKGKRVPLCDDTARLLEHCGFEIVERVHAMLTKQATHNDLFNGTTTTTKSRKSFFRRLAEKKGSPPIDFEEVIFCKRP